MKKLKVFLLSLLLIACTPKQDVVKPDTPYKPITIEAIDDNVITGKTPYFTPYQFIITYTGEENLEDYCIGDIIDVYYQQEPQLPDLEDNNQIQITSEFICESDFKLEPGLAYKPVIYLYPKEETNIHVSLDYNGRLTYTYPYYHDGWNVIAYPDGTIIHKNKSYPYLLWEGKPHYEYDLSQGFCVASKESEAFLDEKLAYLGLNTSEIRDFKEFWLPTLKNNPYNIITFQDECYKNNAKLTIHPQPDSLIRIFMTIQSSSHYVNIPTQSLTPQTRHGYSVIEWGGTIIE